METMVENTLAVEEMTLAAILDVEEPKTTLVYPCALAT
jgi:hypothetical protein